MKKHYRIILLVLLLILSTLILSSCVHVDETLHVDETAESARYYLFRVNDSNKYLQFLENFDSNKYEIVNISIACGQYVSDDSQVLYCVTYRLK